MPIIAIVCVLLYTHLRLNPQLDYSIPTKQWILWYGIKKRKFIILWKKNL